MEFREVLEARRSVRKFKRDGIAEETMQEILQLAQLAPSAGNLQAYRVRIVKKHDVKEKLKEATFGKQESVTSASAVLVICACPEESSRKYGGRGSELYSIQDATIFAAYLQLVLASLDLASVWVGAFSEEKVKEVLELPENLRPIIILPCGYPDDTPHPRERKNLNGIII